MDADRTRHQRQALLPGVGDAGLSALREAHAVIVGVGGLGCVSAEWLARAGVGRLTLVDRDVVERTNLQRQVLFAEADVGEPKAEAAARRLAEIDSSIRIDPIVADFEPANAERIAIRGLGGPVTILIDGTDNFETRYLLNDLAVKHGLPFAYAGAVGVSALAALLDTASDGPCLRCVFAEPPPAGSQPTCDTAGVLGPVVGLAASWQASLAIGRIVGQTLGSKLVEMRPWDGAARTIDLATQHDPACRCCSERRFEFLDGSRWSSTQELCGRDAVQIRPPANEAAPDLASVAERWGSAGEVEIKRSFVRLEPTDERFIITLFHDGRAVIEGVEEPEQARAIYARYVGG
ncbi:MAG: ThiF family adenylyltransferase [Planctomycetota bacterium]